MGILSDIGNFLGFGKSGAEKRLNKSAYLPFNDPKIQGFLPDSLRGWAAQDTLRQAVENMRYRTMNPGALGPNIAEAIAPRVAAESDIAARNFRNMRYNQRGSAARSNMPLSIQESLANALDIAQARAQSGIRRNALADSEQLRRADEMGGMSLLDAILQFTSSGRGQAIQGLGAATQAANQRRGSNMAFFGDLLGMGLGKGGGG